MKIEIVNYFANERELFFWTLYDGPDGIDKATGYATTLEETVCKILDWRNRIANDYYESLSEEERSDGLGEATPGGPEHGDPGRGDDGDSEAGPEH